MRKEVYSYLTKYNIYNPEFKPPDCSFEHASISLQKNEKFQFLREKLLDYYKSYKSQSKYTLLGYSSEQWKTCFYKNLHSLISEVVYTQDIKQQEEMLIKIQNWFFTKLRLPNIAAASSQLSESPLDLSPFKVIQSPIFPKHEKSQSLDAKLKIEVNELRIGSQKIDTLNLGTVDARNKILKHFYHNTGQSHVLSANPSPLPGLNLKKKTQIGLSQLHDFKID